jgi:hypothetical protein
MQKYEVVLKNEKNKLYDRLAIFIFILNGLAICRFLSVANYQKITEVIPGLIILILSLLSIVIYIVNPMARKKKYIFFFPAAGIILYWILIGYWWVGMIMLALFFIYNVSRRQLKITVIPDQISYPSFPKRIIQWNRLNNIVLKDGLITIDFKNNKLIQQQVDESSSFINEKEFNDFCKEQLKSAASV